MGMQCARLPAVRALSRMPLGGRVHLAALFESLGFVKCAKDRAEIFKVGLFVCFVLFCLLCFHIFKVFLLKCIYA